jgi:hypothetical protein
MFECFSQTGDPYFQLFSNWHGEDLSFYRWFLLVCWVICLVVDCFSVIIFIIMFIFVVLGELRRSYVGCPPTRI